MYKVIGDRLIKEEIIETPKQTATIRSDIEVVENPNNETLEIEIIPEKPQETDTHFVVMTLNDGILAYELRERPKPVEEQVEGLKQVVADLTEIVLFGSVE